MREKVTNGYGVKNSFFLGARATRSGLLRYDYDQGQRSIIVDQPQGVGVIFRIQSLHGRPSVHFSSLFHCLQFKIYHHSSKDLPMSA